MVDWYKVPLLNIVYDLFFDDAPTMDQVTGVMNVFGLLNGLNLSTTFALLTLFQNQDVEEVRFKELGHDVYGHFEDMVVLALACVCTALIQLIALFLFTGTINFDDSKGKFSKGAFEAWWWYNRWLFVLELVFSALGITFLILGVQAAYILQHAIDEDDAEKMMFKFGLSNFLGFLLCGFLIPVFILSAGLASRQNFLDKNSEVAQVAAGSSTS